MPETRTAYLFLRSDASCHRAELKSVRPHLVCSRASSCSLLMSAMASAPVLEEPGDLYSRKSRTP